MKQKFFQNIFHKIQLIIKNKDLNNAGLTLEGAAHIGRENFGKKFSRFTMINYFQRCLKVINSKKEFKLPGCFAAFAGLFRFAGNGKNSLVARLRSCPAAFTLVEVLITLVIVGVISVMLLGTIKKIQDIQFRNAYKKAYADINQVIRIPIANGEFARTTRYSTPETEIEFSTLKKYFKVTKECNKSNLYKCWAKGDTVCDSPCSGYKDGVPNTAVSSSFIDAAGRSWAQFACNEGLYLVDINGFKAPNKFGRDRFMFYWADNKENFAFAATDFAMLVPRLGDVKEKHWGCHHPPCYYKSWLK